MHDTKRNHPAARYMRRRIAPGLALIPARDIAEYADRDGRTWLVDGDRTELVTGRAETRLAPTGMAHGLYVDENRPNTTWSYDAHGLTRLETVPASLLERHAPYRRIRKGRR